MAKLPKFVYLVKQGTVQYAYVVAVFGKRELARAYITKQRPILRSIGSFEDYDMYIEAWEVDALARKGEDE